MTLSMARSSAISSCPLTAMEDSAPPSATRYADSVVSRSGAHLLHPVPDPPRAMGNTAAMEAASAFIWVTADRLSTSISWSFHSRMLAIPDSAGMMLFPACFWQKAFGWLFLWDFGEKTSTISYGTASGLWHRLPCGLPLGVP